MIVWIRHWSQEKICSSIDYIVLLLIVNQTRNNWYLSNIENTFSFISYVNIDEKNIKRKFNRISWWSINYSNILSPTAIGSFRYMICLRLCWHVLDEYMIRILIWYFYRIRYYSFVSCHRFLLRLFFFSLFVFCSVRQLRQCHWLYENWTNNNRALLCCSLFYHENLSSKLSMLNSICSLSWHEKNKISTMTTKAESYSSCVQLLYDIYLENNVRTIRSCRKKYANKSTMRSLSTVKR
jgi:hypothetical protein